MIFSPSNLLPPFLLAAVAGTSVLAPAATAEDVLEHQRAEAQQREDPSPDRQTDSPETNLLKQPCWMAGRPTSSIVQTTGVKQPPSGSQGRFDDLDRHALRVPPEQMPATYPKWLRLAAVAVWPHAPPEQS